MTAPLSTLADSTSSREIHRSDHLAAHHYSRQSNATGPTSRRQASTETDTATVQHHCYRCDKSCVRTDRSLIQALDRLYHYRCFVCEASTFYPLRKEKRKPSYNDFCYCFCCVRPTPYGSFLYSLFAFPFSLPFSILIFIIYPAREEKRKKKGTRKKKPCRDGSRFASKRTPTTRITRAPRGDFFSFFIFTLLFILSNLFHGLQMEGKGLMLRFWERTQHNQWTPGRFMQITTRSYPSFLLSF